MKGKKNSVKYKENENIISLFQFVKEIEENKQKKRILKVDKSEFFKYIRDLRNNKYIKINYQDKTEDVKENSTVLLSVKKTSFQSCPSPDKIFKDWLKEEWDNFRTDLSLYAFRISGDKDNKYKYFDNVSAVLPDDGMELFENDEIRVSKFKKWKVGRDLWVEEQREIERAHEVFTELFNQYNNLKKDSHSLELVVANGFLVDKMRKVEYPILTKRVRIKFESSKNIITIEETDANPELELNSNFLREIDNITLDCIDEIESKLKENYYHPLDRNEAKEFYSQVINSLSTKSKYTSLENLENDLKENDLVIYEDPCFIVRKKMNDAIKMIGNIIKDLESNPCPKSINSIIYGNENKPLSQQDSKEETISEKLASVGGESFDILLSKSANAEQLNIAKHAEKYNSVIVQGPPGTGKTHTIANLIGHFLSEGKKILVTSHTDKALKVLKDKISPTLRNLCVSLLDDSKADMEKAIEGISEEVSKSISKNLSKEIKNIEDKRHEIIKNLSEVREKIFNILHEEYKSISYNGEAFSPAEVGKFVYENREKLSYIPGEIEQDAKIPLEHDDLEELYRSNESITEEDECELDSSLPDPMEIITPEEFKENLEQLEDCKKLLEGKSKNWEVHSKVINGTTYYNLSFPNGTIKLEELEQKNIEDLVGFSDEFKHFDKSEWMFKAIVDGKDETDKYKWTELISSIQKTYEASKKIGKKTLGKDIPVLNTADDKIQKNAVDKVLEEVFKKHRKISYLDKFRFRKEIKVAEQIMINGNPISSSEDYQLISDVFELKELRLECSRYWNQIIKVYGGPEFFKLDSNEPEINAHKYINKIEGCINWYSKNYSVLMKCLKDLKISDNIIFDYKDLSSDVDNLKSMINFMSSDLSDFCSTLMAIYNSKKIQKAFDENKAQLSKDNRINSLICQNLISYQETLDESKYKEEYSSLQKVKSKESLYNNRKKHLETIQDVSVAWAEAIRHRKGIHGKSIVPNDIYEAWKWKILSTKIDKMLEESPEKLQKKSENLSRDLKRNTEELSEKKAWRYLTERISENNDLYKNLGAWKDTVKKIGKGTGKRAPMFRAKARDLMVKCQEAVPVWIMPIGKALESLNPIENKFDIVIVDEASQANILALAVIYMGKKVIIVGDDRQVSPMSIGEEFSVIQTNQDRFLKGKIDNYHLFDGKTSIYDIAKLTFTPLMLKEHFRCVPEIIGFSNMLSYDYKIKPLRDASDTNLFPAIVNYQVFGGEKNSKDENVIEAQRIISLLKACIESPEYKDKTFGIISMISSVNQINLLQKLLETHIDYSEIDKRNIICGNAMNFQGDERDVIFLSMVDSNQKEKYLNLKNDGQDDAYKKRFNVATSRAKDQLWVVHSLDIDKDLKSDDIRKRLLEYSMNPSSYLYSHEKIERNADSPFEAEVAKKLNDKGYKISQQWEAGAYRIDIVVEDGLKKIALECDGEKYHSGEEKVREDMERQTILERSGWQFIRVRGSEYYRNPDGAMERIVKELENYEIYPTNQHREDAITFKTNLLECIKQKADAIYEEEFKNVHSENKVYNPF